jgi:hypothetical protein
MTWDDVSAARLDARHLPFLAPLRGRADVRVHLLDDTAWVRWPAGAPEVARCLLPAPGVCFFAQRGGRWFPFGSRLPTADAPPPGDGVPLASVLVPGGFEPHAAEPPAGSPVELRVVRGGGAQPASAVMCSLAALGQWADAATTAELAAVRAARCDDRAVLLGAKLASVPGVTRFWGTDLLVPLGFRPDPDLPPAALREALGVTAGELVLLTADGADVIPRAAFEPLTRAGVRLALAELNRSPAGEGFAP